MVSLFEFNLESLEKGFESLNFKSYRKNMKSQFLTFEEFQELPLAESYSNFFNASELVSAQNMNLLRERSKPFKYAFTKHPLSKNTLEEIIRTISSVVLKKNVVNRWIYFQDPVLVWSEAVSVGLNGGEIRCSNFKLLNPPNSIEMAMKSKTTVLANSAKRFKNKFEVPQISKLEMLKNDSFQFIDDNFFVRTVEVAKLIKEKVADNANLVFFGNGVYWYGCAFERLKHSLNINRLPDIGDPILGSDYATDYKNVCTEYRLRGFSGLMEKCKLSPSYIKSGSVVCIVTDRNLSDPPVLSNAETIIFKYFLDFGVTCQFIFIDNSLSLSAKDSGLLYAKTSDIVNECQTAACVSLNVDFHRKALEQDWMMPVLYPYLWGAPYHFLMDSFDEYQHHLQEYYYSKIDLSVSWEKLTQCQELEGFKTTKEIVRWSDPIGKGTEGYVYKLYPKDVTRDDPKGTVVKIMNCTGNRHLKGILINCIIENIANSYGRAPRVTGMKIFQEEKKIALTMDFVEGITVWNKIRASAHNLAETKVLIDNVLSSLESLHEDTELEHGDPSPSNMFISTGRDNTSPKITFIDFRESGPKSKWYHDLPKFAYYIFTSTLSNEIKKYVSEKVYGILISYRDTDTFSRMYTFIYRDWSKSFHQKLLYFSVLIHDMLYKEKQISFFSAAILYEKLEKRQEHLKLSGVYLPK